MEPARDTWEVAFIYYFLRDFQEILGFSEILPGIEVGIARQLSSLLLITPRRFLRKRSMQMTQNYFPSLHGHS